MGLCQVSERSATQLPWPHCRVFPLGAIPKALESEVMRPVSDHTKSGLKAATDVDSLRHLLRTYEEIAEFLRYGYSMRMMDVEGAFPLLPLAPRLWSFFLLWWFGVWEGYSEVMYLYAHLTAVSPRISELQGCLGHGRYFSLTSFFGWRGRKRS